MIGISLFAIPEVNTTVDLPEEGTVLVSNVVINEEMITDDMPKEMPTEEMREESKANESTIGI